MDGVESVLFPGFSAELGTVALKDTPVVMVRGRRQCGKTTLVRDLAAGKCEFITMTMTQCWLQRAAIRLGWCALSTELPSTKYSEFQTYSGLSRSRWMMIAGSAGFC